MEHLLESLIVSAGRVFQRSRGLHGRRKSHLPPSGRGRAWRAMRWRRSTGPMTAREPIPASLSGMAIGLLVVVSLVVASGRTGTIRRCGAHLRYD